MTSQRRSVRDLAGEIPAVRANPDRAVLVLGIEGQDELSVVLLFRPPEPGCGLSRVQHVAWPTRMTPARRS